MNRAAVIKCAIRRAALLGVAIIVFLSIIPADAQVRTGASKELEHAAAYLLVGSVWAVGFGRTGIMAIAIGILLAAMAGLLEFVQQWIPGRTPSLTDWVAGAAGALAGATWQFSIRTMWRKSANPSIAYPVHRTRRCVPKESEPRTDRKDVDVG